MAALAHAGGAHRAWVPRGGWKVGPWGVFFLAVGVAAVLVAADFVAVVRVVAPLVVALFAAVDFLAAVERVRVVVAPEAVVSLPSCTPLVVEVVTRGLSVSSAATRGSLQSIDT